MLIDFAQLKNALLPTWQGLKTLDKAQQNAHQRATKASVLIPLFWQNDTLFVWLTKRTAHLKDHAGQISFPGGKSEMTDQTPVITALREAEEEIGLPAQSVEVLGFLPDHLTVTDFSVTPVLGLITEPFTPKLDTFEVAELFSVPLSFLLSPENRTQKQVIYENQLREYWEINYPTSDQSDQKNAKTAEKNYRIWGATAEMIVHLSARYFAALKND